MKQVKIILLFFAVIFIFSSCVSMFESRQRRSKHIKEINTELKKYSDVLDIRKTRINPYGIGYTSIGSTTPAISMSLYVKPTNNNREILNELGNNLIVFFNNEIINNEWVSSAIGFRIYINFYFIGVEQSIYYLRYEVGKWYEGGNWIEGCQELFSNR